MEAESLIVFWPASSGGLHLVDTFELKENLCAERKEENGLTPLCWQLFDHCWRVVVSSELLGAFYTFCFISVSSAGIEVLQSEVVILGGLSWNALAHGAQTTRYSELLQIPSDIFFSSDPDDLTYDAQGGLGLWNGPIIDAHFRERGRQVKVLEPLLHQNVKKGRLVQLVRNTRELEHGSNWGIGLDEDTGMECWFVSSR